jgi:hypothetical protein
MITDVLPRLPDRAPGAPPGYEATALSASSPPPGPAPPGPPMAVSPGRPGAVRPRAPQPGEVAFDYGPTVIKSPDAPAGPPDGIQASGPTAPTTPQPSQGSWGAGASSGYAPGGSAGSAARPEGPPADFSSWYNQSPRSGASPGGQGGSDSGYPPPAGYGPAGWQGQAPQQAPGSPAWSGAEYAPSRRKRSGRSGLGWKAAVVALAIIGAAAGAATVVLLHHGHTGSPQGQSSGTGSASGSASGSSSATLPPSTLQIIDAINKPATGPLPSGFSTTSQPAAANEAAGFSIAAPTSWQKTTSGYQTYLRDPANPGTNILLDLTPHTYQDMLQEARYIESQSIPHFPGYHRVGLAATNVRGVTGSWWKFTWNNKGTPQEALDVLFVAHTSAGPQSYALYMTAPVSKFDQTRPVFDEEVETFATLPG